MKLYVFEPLMPADRRAVLAHNGAELVRLAGELAGRVRPPLSMKLGRLVRSIQLQSVITYSYMRKTLSSIRRIREWFRLSLASWDC